MSSVEWSSTRITSSTTSLGMAEKVCSSVAAACRAGMTTMTLGAQVSHDEPRRRCPNS